MHLILIFHLLTSLPKLLIVYSYPFIFLHKMMIVILIPSSLPLVLVELCMYKTRECFAVNESETLMK